MELLDSAPAVRNYPRPLPLPTPDPTTLADTTKEELEIIMKSEIKRFESFDESWPHTQNLPPRRMAAAGLYYKGEGDRVTCAFCRGWLQDWDGNDDPMDEHQKHHSHCRFVLGDEDCGNIPLAPPSPGSDPMDVTRGRRRLYDSYPNCKPVPGGKPAFPTLADSAARLTTFARWPDHTHKQADDLVAAGFYYSLVRDKVRCFYCAVELEQWNMNDIPWLEHARWSPNCEFLIQRRGRFYVDQVEGKQNVKDFIADLRHVAQQKRHSKTFIDEALRNHGVPFDTPQAMRSAVDALDIQDYVLPAIQADDNHNAELLGDEEAVLESHENLTVVTHAVQGLRNDFNQVFEAQSHQLNGFATTIANQSQLINDQQRDIAQHRQELEEQRQRIERLEQRLTQH